VVIRFFSQSWLNAKVHNGGLNLTEFLAYRVGISITTLLLYVLIAQFITGGIVDLTTWVIGNAFALCIVECVFRLGSTFSFERTSGRLRVIITSPTHKLAVVIIYCCGLRPTEARLIKTQDIGLDCGKLYIRESKRHKDRVVILSDDVLRLCTKYNDILHKEMEWSAGAANTSKANEYFFAHKAGRPYSSQWLREQFKECLKKSGLINKSLQLHEMPSVSRSRIYDFRHTFATRWLQNCLDNSEDIYTVLPYLSAYMGHSDFSSTAYYIHMLPERLKASPAIDWKVFDSLIPEATEMPKMPEGLRV